MTAQQQHFDVADLESASCSATAATGDEDSESECETEPAKSFHRRISTNKEIKTSVCTKEGYLMKQTSSFQRLRKRYFKLKGRKLYYAKDTKSVIFDEIDLTDVSVAECSPKNINHSFQVITPFRCLVLCAENRREMEEWIAALKSASNREFYEGIDHDFLSGQHNWYAASHARPTYCNVCREALSGVTSHGLSCEVCKLKAHKRCAAKVAVMCKWTTLSSVGKDIIEDEDGNISMRHQWIEGNLPVSAKCVVCDKTCGSVLRLQDWRCLWCRAMVHTYCKLVYPERCPLGHCRVSVVPPTALHSIGGDEAWEVTKPVSCSPLLVFVNSKSGDNQGVKFLRRFKQILNPAQVFDLMNGGPGLGLNLFKTFEPFRILVCGGDGSIGWVLSELDKLRMHKQCQLGVLPLGTGNDLARVLGWGSACDDDTQLPQLLEKYEKASVKMLDRWSIMTYEGTIPLMRKLTSQDLGEPIAAYEDSVVAHLTKILQSDQHSVVISSAKVLCETVKDFVAKVGVAYEQEVACGGEQDSISRKCAVLNEKLELLLRTLNEEALALRAEEEEAEREEECVDVGGIESEESSGYERQEEPEFTPVEHTYTDEHVGGTRKRRTQFIQRDALMCRANSLKKAVRQIIEHAERALDEQNAQTRQRPGFESAERSSSSSGGTEQETNPKFSFTCVDSPAKSAPSSPSYMMMCERVPMMSTLQVLPTIESVSCENTPCPSPSPSPSPIPLSEGSFGEILFDPHHISSLSLAGDDQVPYEEKQDVEGGEKSSVSGIRKPDRLDDHRSPVASRRISSGITLKTASATSGRIASLSIPAPGQSIREKSRSPPDMVPRRELPIINPLTSLPIWPNVPGANLISKVLLANADALCAAASPLMDPEDQYLNEFEEKCVMNNYFGIGLDAKITLDFHNKREEHPEKCRSRTKNFMWYGVLGGREILHRTYRNLEQRVLLECDGQRIPLPSLQGIVVLNIPSFAGGSNFWGGTKEDDIFYAPSFDDKILEVVAVFGSVQMAASRIMNIQHHRIAQCRAVKITILGEEGVPVQVDGEAWVQPPGIIRIVHKNRAQMLHRNRHLESSLRTWNEKRKGLATGFGPLGPAMPSAHRPAQHHHHQVHNDPPQPTLHQPSPAPSSHLFSEDESTFLSAFVEAAMCLVRSVKIASVGHPALEQELFPLATRTASQLEKLFPGGKVTEAITRLQVTDVLSRVKHLHAETSVFLREKTQDASLRPEIEEKLSAALGNLEVELRRYSVSGGLVYVSHSEDEHSLHDRKRKGLFKLRFKMLDRSKECKVSSPTALEIDVPVRHWGSEEVSLWLDSIQFGEYKDNFLRHDIRGMELLHLERRDFKDLGITKLGHVKRILHATKALAIQHGEEHAC